MENAGILLLKKKRKMPRASNNLKKFGAWFILPIGIFLIIATLSFPKIPAGINKLDQNSDQIIGDFVDQNIEELLAAQEYNNSMFSEEGLCSDNSKLQAEMGFKTSIDLSTGLKNLMKYYLTKEKISN